MNRSAQPSILRDSDTAHLESELNHAKIPSGGLGDMTIVRWTAPAGKRARASVMIQQVQIGMKKSNE